MKQEINLRLTLIALIAVVMSTLGITAAYYHLFLQQVRTDLRVSAELLSASGIFDKRYQEGSDDEDMASLDNLEEAEEMRITWIDADGSVLYDNDADTTELGNHLDRPEIEAALETGSGESIRQSETMNLNTVYYALLLNNGTILRMSTKARTILNVYAAVLPVAILIIIIVFMFCILVGHLLTRQLLKPIAEMTEHLDEPKEASVYRELQPFQDKIRSQHENILSAARVRQDFTANVSHELKTPLTAISGYAELIENHMVEGDQTTHVAEQIRHNAERLLTLINDIIRLSELDQTEIDRHFTEVNLFETAREVCENLTAAARQKTVTLNCRGENAFLSAEPALIRELVENIVQNAIRYNKPEGKVDIEVFTDNSHPVLTVTDTGIGIPKDQQERIFERFYRVDKSRSRETGGTGLGMAIVKHIAELHHAEIRLTSEIDSGTEVKVIF